MVLDAITYYGELISPNKVETRDGYLVCLDVPIARTGSQLYRHNEFINADSISDYIKDGMNSVYRSEQEVFNPTTIASFEGVPLTRNHPPEPVNSNNWKTYAEGVVTNVRRGTGEFSENLIADIRINDASLVTVVENKIMEQISCGYSCDWAYIDGKIQQINIRGNHVAVVQRGRAGNSVAIRDELVEEGSIVVDEKEKTLLESILSGANLKSIEDVKQLNQIVMALDEQSAVEDEDVKTDNKEGENQIMDEKMNDILEKLSTIVDALANSYRAEPEKVVEKVVEKKEVVEEDAMEEIKEDACASSVEDSGRAVVLSDTAIKDAVVAYFKPVVANLTNVADKQVMSDALHQFMLGDDVNANTNTVNNLNNFINITNKNSTSAVNDSVIPNPTDPTVMSARAKQEQQHYKMRTPDYSEFLTKGSM